MQSLKNTKKKTCDVKQKKKKKKKKQPKTNTEALCYFLVLYLHIIFFLF